MEFIKIAAEDRLKYIDLLLIADEQLSMVEKYLYRGEMFVLFEEEVKAACIVTNEKPEIYEIKNIVTVPKYQRKGYGGKLIEYIVSYYRRLGNTLYVGTGDSPMTIDFYKKCGFVPSHLVKNFFVDNYDHPIIEDGKQLIDMIYLKRKLK